MQTSESPFPSDMSAAVYLKYKGYNTVTGPGGHNEVIKPGEGHNTVTRPDESHNEVIKPGEGHNEVTRPDESHNEVIKPGEGHDTVTRPGESHNETICAWVAILTSKPS